MRQADWRAHVNFDLMQEFAWQRFNRDGVSTRQENALFGFYCWTFSDKNDRDISPNLRCSINDEKIDVRNRASENIPLYFSGKNGMRFAICLNINEIGPTGFHQGNFQRAVRNL